LDQNAQHTLTVLARYRDIAAHLAKAFRAIGGGNRRALNIAPIASNQISQNLLVFGYLPIHQHHASKFLLGDSIFRRRPDQLMRIN
jgi:hypothetical protein